MLILFLDEMILYPKVMTISWEIVILKAQLLLFKLENNVIKSGSGAENATFPQELTLTT